MNEYQQAVAHAQTRAIEVIEDRRKNPGRLTTAGLDNLRMLGEAIEEALAFIEIEQQLQGGKLEPGTELFTATHDLMHVMNVLQYGSEKWHPDLPPDPDNPSYYRFRPDAKPINAASLRSG